MHKIIGAALALSVIVLHYLALPSDPHVFPPKPGAVWSPGLSGPRVPPAADWPSRAADATSKPAALPVPSGREASTEGAPAPRPAGRHPGECPCGPDCGCGADCHCGHGR
jgi:hypothetical protein